MPSVGMPRASIVARTSAAGSRPGSLRAWIFWLLITMSVPMWPGITTETWTCGALMRKSSRRASEKPFTANFAAL